MVIAAMVDETFPLAALATIWKYFEGRKDEDGNVLVKKNVPLALKLLAEDIEKLYHTRFVNGELYMYKDGLFVPGQMQHIHWFINVALKRAGTTKQINEVINLVKSFSYQGDDYFKQPTSLINLENGVYDIINGSFHDHDPKYRFLYKLPVWYDPEAQCPEIDSFLESIFPANAHKQKILVQFLANCLLKESPVQQFIVMYGTGGNGKGVYYKLVESFLGKENCASQTLRALVKEFGLSPLVDKLANLGSEERKEVNIDSSIIKALTGQDLVTVNRKYKHQYTTRLFAKHIFSTNYFIEFNLDLNAHTRRVVYLHFAQSFFGTEQYDPKIVEKITTPTELSGLLNKVISEIPTLLKQGFYG